MARIEVEILFEEGYGIFEISLLIICVFGFDEDVVEIGGRDVLVEFCELLLFFGAIEVE